LILNRFLFRRFLAATAVVLLIICGVIFSITFVEKLPNSADVLDAMKLSFFALMDYVPLFLPLAIFMGTLMAYYNLTRRSELVIVASSGFSPYQVMRPMLVAAGIIGCLTSMVLNPYTVRVSNNHLDPSKLALIDDAIWLRGDTDKDILTLRAENMQSNQDQIIFSNATLFRQAPNFKLVERIEAKTVTLSDGKLQSDRVRIFDATSRPKNLGKWSVATKLTPRVVLDKYLRPDQVSFWQLPRFIQEMRGIGVNPRGHQTHFWTLLLMPLSLVAMVVLGAAFSQTHQRRGHRFGSKFSIGIAVSFALYFTMNMFATMGTSGALPTLLAVLAPPLIIIAAAGTFIVSYDTI